MQGEGTDSKIGEADHIYTEYYTDPEWLEPLVDYSYMYDKNGDLIRQDNGHVKFDRWDYWTVDDFTWRSDKSLNVLDQ